MGSSWLDSRRPDRARRIHPDEPFPCVAFPHRLLSALAADCERERDQDVAREVKDRRGDQQPGRGRRFD